MARVSPVTKEEISPAMAGAFEQHVATYNTRITNMKATLAHSPLAFDIYMQWYPLYEKIKSIVGDRPAYLFAYSISFGSDCPLCSTYFRKKIIEAGEKPENLELNDYERKLLEFGAAISRHTGHIAEDIYHALAMHHSNEEMVLLIAFAGQMMATNVFSNVTDTDIDEYLIPFLAATK